MRYSGQVGYKPDYLYLMQRLLMDSPEAAVNLAKMIAKQPGPPIDLNTLADLFLQRNAIREATAFLLDVLQDNKPEHDKLQTKVTICTQVWLVWCAFGSWCNLSKETWLECMRTMREDHRHFIEHTLTSTVAARRLPVSTW